MVDPFSGNGGLESDLPPTVHERLTLLYQRRELSPQKRRVLQYLAANPGARTHQVAQGAFVSYPPSAFHKLRLPLASVGLQVERLSPSPTQESAWRLALAAR